MKIVIILFSIFYFLFSTMTYAAVPQQLQDEISKKASELQELNKQMQETQQALESTQQRGRTIEREIKTTEQSINQLNLGIKTNEIQLQKLNLEAEALEYEIVNTESTIELKRKAIGQLLREVQQKDNEPLLATLLKNGSLADGVMEIQGLMDLNSGLSVEITNLRQIKIFLDLKLSDVSENKQKTSWEKSSLANRKVVVEDQKTAQKRLLSQTASQAQTFQQQLAELEKKQEEISLEIEELEHRLQSQFDTGLLPLKRPGVFAYPVENVRFTQGYGPAGASTRRFYKFHNGVDFGVPVGAPVFAATEGVVVAVDNNDKGAWKNYQYGKYILIQHDNNLSTLYAHLSGQVVKVGDSVTRGQLIGHSGGARGTFGSGISTGPHLHFTAYYCGSVGWLQNVPRDSQLCGFASIPPAVGRVPIGAHIDPSGYLP